MCVCALVYAGLRGSGWLKQKAPVLDAVICPASYARAIVGPSGHRQAAVVCAAFYTSERRCCLSPLSEGPSGFQP